MSGFGSHTRSDLEIFQRVQLPFLPEAIAQRLTMFDVLRNKVSKFQNKINSRRRGAIKKISLGICAMDKKAQSKPMKEILSRLSEDVFEVTIFGNQRILEEPIETWPVVECLIAFYLVDGENI